MQIQSIYNKLQTSSYTQEQEGQISIFHRTNKESVDIWKKNV